MQKKAVKFKVTPVLVRNVFLALVLGIVVFSAGYVAALKKQEVGIGDLYPHVTINRELPEDKKDLNFDLFWQVWDSLNAKYYDKDKLVPAKMVYGAIEGMVAAVGDPYTVFLPPTENKVVQEDLNGNFEGVGVQIGFKGQQLAVIAPLPGSPAEKAGLLPGDFIVGIQDKTKDVDRGTVGITLPEAVQIIRGPAGSLVTLAITRNGVSNPFLVDIERESINVPSVIVTYEGENQEIAHVKVLKFAGETFGEWSDAVADILVHDNVEGIIMDVRNNPGGYLQGAVELASDFMDVGDVVVTEDRGSEKFDFEVERLGRLKNKKVVILINGGSASASEIFAGAMRDNLGTKLVGETSFGKGTIQEPQQLTEGSGLHLTIARWLTPKGTWVNEVGLEPDVTIESNPETTEDEQLIEALRLIKQ